jgi:MHS family proline/betaine transporter-like MFS transporter
MADHRRRPARTVAASEARPEPHGPVNAGRRRLILAGMAGNVMEWYDFSVYGYFAATLGRHFFPSEDATASLLAAFGVFAAGFLMRPVGALLFGHIGDRIGRQAALIMSVLAMAVPTFLIGVLPDHAQIGLAASALLVGLRLVQGVSAGGEHPTSVVFFVEGAAPDRRGFMGSWSFVGSVSGILLGSAVGALTSTVFPAATVEAWGWRIPFLLSLGVGLVGWYLRRHLREAPTVREPEPPAISPVAEAFRTQWQGILRVAALNVLTAIGFYLIFVYAVTYLEQVMHVRTAAALDINTFSMGVLLLVMPAAGVFSDRIGRKPVLLGAALGTLVLAWPLFWLMHHPVLSLMLVGQLGFAVLLGLFIGVIPTTMAEAFPARVRVTGVSIAYNMALALLGGTTPMVVTYLLAWSHNPLAPAYYLMGAAAVSLAVLMSWPESVNAPLP